MVKSNKTKTTLETLLSQAADIEIESIQFSYIKKSKNIIILKQVTDYSKKLYTRIQQFKLEIKDLKTRYAAMPDTEKLELPSDFEINSEKHKELLNQAADKNQEKNKLEETISYLKDRLLELESHWKLNVRLRFPKLEYQPKIAINQDGNICYDKNASIEVSEVLELLSKAMSKNELDFNNDDVTED